MAEEIVRIAQPLQSPRKLWVAPIPTEKSSRLPHALKMLTSVISQRSEEFPVQLGEETFGITGHPSEEHAEGENRSKERKKGGGPQARP